MEVVRLHSNLARFLCHGLGFKTVANLITLDALTSVARVSLLLTYPYLSDLFPLPPNSETALCTSAYGQNRMDLQPASRTNHCPRTYRIITIVLEILLPAFSIIQVLSCDWGTIFGLPQGHDSCTCIPTILSKLHFAVHGPCVDQTSPHRHITEESALHATNPIASTCESCPWNPLQYISRWLRVLVQERSKAMESLQSLKPIPKILPRFDLGRPENGQE